MAASRIRTPDSDSVLLPHSPRGSPHLSSCLFQSVSGTSGTVDTGAENSFPAGGGCSPLQSKLRESQQGGGGHFNTGDTSTDPWVTPPWLVPGIGSTAGRPTVDGSTDHRPSSTPHRLGLTRLNPRLSLGSGEAAVMFFSTRDVINGPSSTDSVRNRLLNSQ